MTEILFQLAKIITYAKEIFFELGNYSFAKNQELSISAQLKEIATQLKKIADSLGNTKV